MTRAFAVMFVMLALLANPAAAQRSGRSSGMGFAPHAGFAHPGFGAPGFGQRGGFFGRPGFGPRPGFFPQRNFANNRFFFGGVFVAPGVVAAYPPYPYPYYPYPYPYYPPYPVYGAPP